MFRYALLFFPALLLSLSACASSSTGLVSADSQSFGVVVMAHGGTPDWNAGVLDAVRPLEERYDLEVAFGMADADSLQEAVTKLEDKGVRRIAVVRLFVSGDSFKDATEEIFGLRAGAPERGGEEVLHPVMAEYMSQHADRIARYAKENPEAVREFLERNPGEAHAFGDYAPKGEHEDHAESHGDAHAHHGHGHGHDHDDHSMAYYRLETQSAFAISERGLMDDPDMAIILYDRAKNLSQDPSTEDILILAHGPGDDDENARWLAQLDVRANKIRQNIPFRRVKVATLREDWADKRLEVEKELRAYVSRAVEESGTAIVIPFRVQGFGEYDNVLKGLEFRADRLGLIPHEEITRWIEREIQSLRAQSFRTPFTR